MVNTRPVAALFGGSFDPPHRGHQRIVASLLKRDGIETVIVVPAFRNPFKHIGSATPQQRLAWCRTVFSAPGVIIDEGEVTAGRPVYTVETFRRLSRQFDIRYIVIGSDNLPAIDRWHDFETLNAEVIWLVYEREGFTDGYEKLRRYERIALNEPVSSTAIRDREQFDAVDPRIAEEVARTLYKGNT